MQSSAAEAHYTSSVMTVQIKFAATRFTISSKWVESYSLYIKRNSARASKMNLWININNIVRHQWVSLPFFVEISMCEIMFSCSCNAALLIWLVLDLRPNMYSAVYMVEENYEQSQHYTMHSSNNLVLFYHITNRCLEHGHILCPPMVPNETE